MKKPKTIFTIIAILAVIVGAAIFALQQGWLKLNLEKEAESQIEETTNVVTEIKKISEFTSACYYKEIILRETKTRESSIKNKVFKMVGKNDGLTSDEIVIIAGGKVRAGFNLEDLTDDNVIANSDTLMITLPKAEILDVIVNPSDFDVYIENGEWPEEKVIEIKNKAIAKIENDAIKDGILEKAKDAGIKRLSDMFKIFGFSEVNIKLTE